MSVSALRLDVLLTVLGTSGISGAILLIGAQLALILWRGLATLPLGVAADAGGA